MIGNGGAFLVWGRGQSKFSSGFITKEKIDGYVVC